MISRVWDVLLELLQIYLLSVVSLLYEVESIVLVCNIIACVNFYKLKLSLLPFNEVLLIGIYIYN